VMGSLERTLSGRSLVIVEIVTMLCSLDVESR